jgi:hypothetical protein
VLTSFAKQLEILQKSHRILAQASSPGKRCEQVDEEDDELYRIQGVAIESRD